MKKLFIAALLFVGIASFAQDVESKPAREQRERLTPEQRNEKQLKKLTSELTLDAKQQEQVKQLLAERNTKAEKLRESRSEQRDAFKKELKAEKEANDTKMKAILNADQYTKWKALQEKNKDKAREKIKERRKEKI